MLLLFGSLCDSGSGFHEATLGPDVHGQFAGLEDALAADLLGDEDREKVVGDLFEALDAFDVSADDGLFFLENADVPVDLSIGELLVLEGLKGGRYLILGLVVEEDVVGARGVVDLELRPHRLVDPP